MLNLTYDMFSVEEDITRSSPVKQANAQEAAKDSVTDLFDPLLRLAIQFGFNYWSKIELLFEFKDKRSRGSATCELRQQFKITLVRQFTSNELFESK